MLKKFIKKFLPARLLNRYHLILAQVASLLYRQPSDSMIVIGITGTSGKSTVCELLWHILNQTGQRVGLASGIRFCDGVKSIPNNTKMTMLGRFELQHWLSRMKTHGCRYAIIEVTSQGLAQHRQVGINFDLALITNFWSEHDRAHGGLEAYKQAKGILFASLTKNKHKIIDGQEILKTIVTNADSDANEYFSSFQADQKKTFALEHSADVQAKKIKLKAHGSEFNVGNSICQLPLLGKHNIANALAAIAAASGVGLTIEQAARSLATLSPMPGRMEFINQGQNFTIIVDYAFEPKAMEQLYTVIKFLPHKKIIHVLGTTGGGRDTKRGEILGGMAAQTADYVIATDEDPYDDDPMMLIQRVVTGAQNNGKELDQNLFIKEKRLDGIAKGISLAEKGDIVLITGKGSEGSMCIANGKKIPWDDREVVREILKSLK